jgi:hypothetical protein
MKTKILDWAGNEVYPGYVFDSITGAWDFLTADQHNRHPRATEDEFNEIMGEFQLAAYGDDVPSVHSAYGELVRSHGEGHDRETA